MMGRGGGGCRFSSGAAARFIKRQIEGPGRGEALAGKKGDDGDNDNGERLLTKIEVVVMTGIARDEALRGDALVDALASSDQKDRAREDARGCRGERRRARERAREKSWGIGGGGEREDTRKRAGECVEDDNSGAEHSCQLS